MDINAYADLPDLCGSIVQFMCKNCMTTSAVIVLLNDIITRCLQSYVHMFQWSCKIASIINQIVGEK